MPEMIIEGELLLAGFEPWEVDYYLHMPDEQFLELDDSEFA